MLQFQNLLGSSNELKFRRTPSHSHQVDDALQRAIMLEYG